MKHLFAPAVAFAAIAASPAAAQSADEKINMVIAYDASECPVAGPGEVVICEILVEADRYRIPSNLRYSDNPANKSPAWAKDKSEAEAVRFGLLIEKARTERMSTIDADAAAEQERVEMIEREYMQRLERERQGELPGEGTPPPPPPPGQ